MNKKQRYTIAIVFMIVFSFVMLYYSPIQYLVQAYAKLDSDLKHIFSIITVAGLGLILFAVRHLNIKKEQLEQIEAWDLAVMILIPSADGFAYIMKIPANYPWAILVYFCGVMTWFLLVICRHKIFKDPKEENKFTFSIVYSMSVFVIFGLFALWEIISILHT